MSHLFLSLTLLFVQQEPAIDVEGYRDRLRRNLETRCLAQPYFRECRNLEDPGWRPPVPRCIVGREDIS
jgi:hypothetical protein